MSFKIGDKTLLNPTGVEFILVEQADGSYKRVTVLSVATLATNVQIGNYLRVDTVKGNDTTGTRERFHLPFKTITAALTASQANDLLDIFPGTYDEADLLRDQRNLYFRIGAKVVSSGTTTVILNDTANNRLRIKIMGAPHFEYTGGVSNEVLLLESTQAHEIEFHNTEMISTNAGETIGIDASNANIFFNECVLRNKTNNTVISTVDFNRFYLKDTWVVGENTGSSAEGIELSSATSIMEFDNTRIVLASFAGSIAETAGAAVQIKIYGVLLANNATTVTGGGSITNIITGTSLIVDSDVTYWKT